MGDRFRLLHERGPETHGPETRGPETHGPETSQLASLGANYTDFELASLVRPVWPRALSTPWTGSTCT